MTFIQKYRWVVMAVALAGLVLTLGCGKKGAPLPPVTPGNILAIPDNLAYTLGGNTLTLTWTHTVDPVNARLAPQAFAVYQAVKTQKECQGCPFVFETVGQVFMPDMVFRQELQPDVQYYFRVQAIGKNGAKSEVSPTLQIEFE